MHRKLIPVSIFKVVRVLYVQYTVHYYYFLVYKWKMPETLCTSLNCALKWCKKCRRYHNYIFFNSKLWFISATAKLRITEVKSFLEKVLTRKNWGKHRINKTAWSLKYFHWKIFGFHVKLRQGMTPHLQYVCVSESVWCVGEGVCTAPPMGSVWIRSSDAWGINWTSRKEPIKARARFCSNQNAESNRMRPHWKAGRFLFSSGENITTVLIFSTQHDLEWYCFHKTVPKHPFLSKKSRPPTHSFQFNFN